MDAVTRYAAKIISAASKTKPADGLLRTELKNSSLSRSESSDVAEMVFAFFRWRGWVNSNAAVQDQIIDALELDRRFQKHPETFADDNLERAIPPWTNSAVEVSREWLTTLQKQPTIWLRAKRGQGADLAHELSHSFASEGLLADAVRYVGREDLFRTDAFQEGRFEIQDIASQLVSLLANPAPGETWWDACAGEGGKTLHLSDLMQNKGLLWASDRSEWRLKRLKQRTARASVFNYRAVPWNGEARLPTKTRFHGVLVDAPCSGIGTWQRNPHARWTTTIEDVRELGEIQKQIVKNVAPAVRPGGKLIYSVCTLTKIETDDVADFCSRELPEFEPLPLPSLPNERPAALGRKWIWPQDFSGNGMYVAAWQRR
jgi:16S rRNA (cytosine967-C5)-methyltransferase